MLRRVIALTVVSTLIGPLSVATAATSDAMFVREANGICRQQGAEVRKVPEVTADNAVSVLTRTAGIVSELARRLDLVAAPPAKAPKFKAYRGILRQSVTEVRHTITAIKRHDAAGVRTSMRRAVAADQHGDTYATALGLADCAKDY